MNNEKADKNKLYTSPLLITQDNIMPHYEIVPADQRKDKVALVLGGTTPHIYLVMKLQSMGYYVILIDYLDNPPARDYADEHLQISTLDKEAVLECARQRHAKLVISTNIDQVNVVVCYVAEKLNLPHPYSYETALKCTDKELMKKQFKQGGIPTSDFVVFNKNDQIEIPDTMKYPLVIKPVDSNSSKGVFKVKDYDELKRLTPDSYAASRRGAIIIEEFVEGAELVCEFVVIDGKAVLLEAWDTGDKVQHSSFLALGNIGYAQGPNCTKHKKQIVEIGQRIADSFGLKNTMMFFQGIASDNEVSVIECAARTPGANCFYGLYRHCGFDCFDIPVRLFMGEKVELNLNPPNNVLLVKNFRCPSGIYEGMLGVEECLRDGCLDAYLPLRTVGTYVEEGPAMNSIIGCLFTIGDTIEEAKLKMNKVCNNVTAVMSDKGTGSLTHFTSSTL